MDHVIPFDRLPPGFAESLDDIPDEPAAPRPAATILMLRDGSAGMETLMLRRTRRSGFVPGAWVFAGGRVDFADADHRVVGMLRGLTPELAGQRLQLDVEATPPAIAYFVAALREAFEETGLLVGIDGDGSAALAAGEDREVASIRDRLLDDEIDFAQALTALDVQLDGGAVEYVAHWITPVQERRRYDTRFFAAAVQRDREVLLHPAEMTDARWLTPAAALESHARGELPMVFPTIRTLEDLLDFQSVASALESFSSRTIPAILPRLVRTPTGVGLEVP